MNKLTCYEEMDLSFSKEKEGLLHTIVVSDADPLSIEEIHSQLKKYVSKKFENELKMIAVQKDSLLEQQIKHAITNYLNENNIIFTPLSLKAKVIKDYMLTLSGYGILQPLMDDDAIEEIYIYAPNKIYYLKNGKKILSDIAFKDEDTLKAFIDNVLGRINRTVNNRNPIEDGRLPDGSRVAVSGNVLSPNGYTMNIRKFRKEKITLEKLVELESMDERTKELLKAVIKSKLNFLVSGGTSSGKTTLLNAMAEYIPADENVESIEDNIELQLNRSFWLQLETRKANLEGEGEITMEDLLVHLLRRSPDRIVVGEIRTGGVADTFLNAIQTGHDGTCSTVHANSPERCRARVCKLASVASKQPYKSACDDFDHSIHIIIQLKKSEILKRRLVTDVVFVSPEGKLSNLVHYDFEKRCYVHADKYPLELETQFKEYGIELK